LKILSKDAVAQAGRVVMLYGGKGVGKTVSILHTSPTPILYIQTEPRSLKPLLDAADRSDLDTEGR